MKKTLAIILAALLVIAALPAFAADDVTVTVNGTEVYFDQPPVILDGRTLVPIRAVFEAMGYEVGYEGESRQITITDGDRRVVCRVGDASYEKYAGGVLTDSGAFDVVPQVINGRTLVPVRALSEAFGCDVEWKGDARTVVINDADAVKIGVLCLIDHPTTDEIRRGFSDALKDNGIKSYIEYKFAGNNPEIASLFAEDFAADGKDMIFAIYEAAIPCAVATGIPTVFAATFSKYYNELDLAGANVTGTVDDIPIAGQMELLRTLVPDVRSVAIVYYTGSDEIPEEVTEAENILGGMGIDTVRVKCADSVAQAKEAVASVAGQVQAIYAVESYYLAHEETAKEALAAKIPLIVGTNDGQDLGDGLATVAINYYGLGYQAGEMAARYLKGEVGSLGEIPVESQPSDEAEVVINYETAKALGLDLRK